MRVLLKPQGRSSHSLTTEQQDQLLEPFVSDLVGYTRMLEVVGRQHYLRGQEQVHTLLHDQPGVDHELLDEAVEYHLTKEQDDAIVFE